MSNLDKNSDHRKQKRWHLIYYLKVFNKDTGELLGHMADITTRGILVIGEKEIKEGQPFNLTMHLPESFHDLKELHFEAESHWTKKDINPDYYANGFKFVKISKTHLEIIKELIQKYFFNE